MGRGRPRKVQMESQIENQMDDKLQNEIDVIEKQKAETALRKVVQEKWYAISGNKLLQRVRTGSGVQSVFIGLTNSKRTKEFIDKLKSKGERIENIV